MPVLLLALAILVAVVSVPTVAGMTAWGLSGGDGSPDTPVLGVLGAVVGFGGLYNAVTSWLAVFGIDAWQWLLMWAAPAAALTGLLLSLGELRRDDVTPADVLVGVAIPIALAVPAALVWAAGAGGG